MVKIDAKLIVRGDDGVARTTSIIITKTIGVTPSLLTNVVEGRLTTLLAVEKLIRELQEHRETLAGELYTEMARLPGVVRHGLMKLKAAS